MSDTPTHPRDAWPQTHPTDGPTHISDVLPVDNPDRWRSRPNPDLHIGPTARPCPTCGAQRGDPCLDRDGAPQDGYHRSRSARPKPAKPATTRAPAAPHRGKGPHMSEDDLGREVAKLVRAAGARSMHVRRGRRTDGSWETATSIPGWLDLVIFGPRCCVLFRELKGSRGVLTPKQRDVIDQLRAAGADAGCWWPSDLADGTIARELGLNA